MTTTEKIAWRKLSLWWPAQYPTSVGRACKVIGYSC